MKTDYEKLKALEAEVETHDRIMSRLDDVKGYEDSYFYINGFCHSWCVTTLKEEELKEIVLRKNHEEILKLIHQYGKAAPEYDWEKGRWCNPYGYQHILPDFVQEFIASRCNDEEIRAYIQYQGFGLAGQKAFYKQSTDEQKKAYINLHGFLPEVQEMLRADNKTDIINLHIAKHGMHYYWEKDIIDTSNFELFKSCVNLHEFSVHAQQHLCLKGTPDKISYYINKYGLWYEAHVDLVQCEYDYIIYNYIQKHRYFCYNAEIALITKGNHNLIMFYIKHRYGKTSPSFLQALKTANRQNYIEILACLKEGSFNDEYNKTEIEFMQSNHEDEILQYLEDNTPSSKALYALLKSNNEKAKIFYLQKAKL